jgi:Mor family transcriptional regulator
MSYKRAEEVLPEEIIHILQQYAEGVCIYIPKKKNSRNAWGSGTAIREELDRRNRCIYEEYRSGSTPQELAEQYFLSHKSIERIIAGMKRCAQP